MESPGSSPGQDAEPGLLDRAKQWWQRINQVRVMRALKRYGAAQGGLLAGGIAYTSLFSIVAALTIAWTVFMATLGSDLALRASVIAAVNDVLPGILKDSNGSGMVDPKQLILESAINPASIIAALVLVWSAIGIMSNIRSAVQSMFGIVAPPVNMVQQKLRDLFGFAAMALGIVTSALLGTAAGTLGATVMRWLGLADNRVAEFFVRGFGLLVASLIAAATFALLFRITAAVRPLRRDLILGSVVGGVVVHILLSLGTGVVSSVSDDPLLASAAGLASLLLFVNLLSRVLLMVAAFTANPPQPVTPDTKEEVHFDETPNFVTLSAEHTLNWTYQDITGQLEPDPALRPETIREDGTHAELRPDGKPIPRTDIGLVPVLWLQGKATRMELDVVELRARLGQRPRIQEAEERYWADRDGAHCADREGAHSADRDGARSEPASSS